MADDDKVVADDKPVEKPIAEEATDTPSPTPTPASDPVASADDAAVPAGTDQQGRQLYDVKCADCGKDTQVPFKPSGNRPVYCRDCYMQKRGGADRGMRRGPGR